MTTSTVHVFRNLHIFNLHKNNHATSACSAYTNEDRLIGQWEQKSMNSLYLPAGAILHYNDLQANELFILYIYIIYLLSSEHNIIT